MYEIRCLESGRFITRARNIPELGEIREGFASNLPLIPFSLVQQVIGFFRSCMRDGAETEALVRVYWDRTQERFLLDIPHQKVSKARIFADIPIGPEKEDGLIHYADIHSHNSMAAQFSSIDDTDEKGDRLYLVMGRLDSYFPEVSSRRYLPGSATAGPSYPSTPAMCWRGCQRRSPIGGPIEHSCWRIPFPFLPPKRPADTQNLPRPRKNLRRGNKPWQG